MARWIHMIRTAGCMVLLLIVVPSAAPPGWAGNSCVDCHRRSETIRELPAWYQDQFIHWYGSVHAKKGVTCDKCHGGDPTRAGKKPAHQALKPVTDSQSPVYFKNLPETCGACHRGVYRQFIQSRHYKNLKEDRLGPTCTTCHGFQMDIGGVAPIQLAGRCTVCHNARSGNKPQVADQTRHALEEVARTEHAILRSGLAIELLAEPGGDTPAMQARLDALRQRLRATGELWHTFNLNAFEKELAQIQAQAQKVFEEAAAGKREKK